MCQIVKCEDFKVLKSEAGKEPVFYKVVLKDKSDRYYSPYYNSRVALGVNHLPKYFVFRDTDMDSYIAGRKITVSEYHFGSHEMGLLDLCDIKMEDDILVTSGEGLHLFPTLHDAAINVIEAFPVPGKERVVLECKVPKGAHYWFGKCVIEGRIYDSVCANQVIYTKELEPCTEEG